MNEFFKRNKSVFRSLKLAIVKNIPEIIFPVYYKEIYSEENKKAFSTVIAAKNWILI